LLTAKAIELMQQRLKPVEGKSIHAVYETLRQSILDGTLKPGQRLLSSALADELNVSRTPIREALRKLEAEGLIEPSPRSGLIVREISEEDLTELFYVREALEGMSARLAAENASKSALLELHVLLDDMEAALKKNDLKLVRKLTGEFQMAVSQASQNKRLVQMLKVLLDQIRQVQTSTLFIKGRAKEALGEHRRLVQAIEARDAELAERLARQHRQNTLQLRRGMVRDQIRKNRS
jgi:DNA-binding GntR family transcriptional regulator